jgi:hypothetical protein
MTTPRFCPAVAVTLDSPEFSFTGTASGLLTLKDAPPAPEPLRCMVTPAGGDTTTTFVFTSPAPAGAITAAWAVVARGGGREWFAATVQPDGTYRAQTKMAAGTYTYQCEFRLGADTVYVNPPPNTTLVVAAAQPPVPWVPTVPTAAGPLRREGAKLVRPDGTEVRLFGRHTWDSTFDAINDQRWRAFDFDAYLAQMNATGENVTRLWRWEQSFWWTLLTPPDYICTVLYHDGPFVGPEWVQPWLRPQTGEPRGHDGLWKFDLSLPDDGFFARARERVLACQAAGIYPIVMLHEGWNLRDPQGEYWQNHAFNPTNNLQGYPVDRNGIYNVNGPLMPVWEAYMVATLADCPMVIWEVANEARVESLAWQEWVMSRVRQLEAGQPIKHPIGMTCLDGGTDEMLAASSADWISPGSANYKTPGPNTTGKPVFLDSDHLWGMGVPSNGCTVQWVQQLAAQGYHGLLMDPAWGNIWPVEPTLDPVKAALGAAARAANS